MQNAKLYYIYISIVSILTLAGTVFWLFLEIDRFQETIVSLDQENAGLHQDLDLTQSKLEQLDKSLKQTNEKLTGAESSIATLTSDNETLQQSNDELRKQIDSKDAEIQRLKDTTPKIVYKYKDKPVEKTVSRSSSTQPKGRTIAVQSTAYTAYCNGCSGLTRWNEIDLRKNPHLKVIAVDPNVIPLGSKVYVEGYGYAIAADTGGAIKGNKIDVFIPTQSEALAWGRKTVMVTVID